MQDNTTSDKSKMIPERDVKSSLESSQESTLKKPAQKVVKNPLFGLPSKPAPKKEMPTPPKVQNSELKQAQKQPEQEVKLVEVKIQALEPKVESVQLEEMKIDQEKPEKDEQPVKEEIRPKKKTVKDLFSNIQPQSTQPRRQQKQAEPQPQSFKQKEIENKKKEDKEEKGEEEPHMKQIVQKNVSNIISEEKQVFEVKKHAVSIKVTESAHVGTTLHKNTLFTIEGKDDHGSFCITRKYTEFKALKKLLKDRWPGCFIPGLTSKSDVKKQDQKQKDVRLILANFLLGLSYSPLMYYKEQIQLFLRSPNIQIQEMSQKMPTLKMRDVISRFSSYFGQSFFEKKAESTSIQSFTVSLRKIISMMPLLINKALQMCEIYDNYALGMSKLAQFSKNYEKIFLMEYSNNKLDCTLIAKDTSKIIDKLNEYSSQNPFYQIYNFFSCEARDAQSFLDVLIASELFSLKKGELDVQIKQTQRDLGEVALGHKTLKTMTTRKTKEEVKVQLEGKLAKLKEERDNAIEIYSMTSALLDKLSIQTFKTFKRDRYRKALKQWCAHSTRLVPEIEALWSVFEDELKTLLK